MIVIKLPTARLGTFHQHPRRLTPVPVVVLELQRLWFFALGPIGKERFRADESSTGQCLKTERLSQRPRSPRGGINQLYALACLEQRHQGITIGVGLHETCTIAELCRPVS